MLLFWRRPITRSRENRDAWSTPRPSSWVCKTPLSRKNSHRRCWVLLISVFPLRCSRSTALILSKEPSRFWRPTDTPPWILQSLFFLLVFLLPADLLLFWQCSSVPPSSRG